MTSLSLFFFNDTATTEIYTLSLHDALPISFFAVCLGRSLRRREWRRGGSRALSDGSGCLYPRSSPHPAGRSEEHTSELQSRLHLVCRLLLEKKKSHSRARRPLCGLTLYRSY